MIISHKHPKYENRRRILRESRHNGAYYYSREICEIMIPLVETDRNWITINIPNVGCDHAIVFIHNNLRPETYDHLSRYEDLILVCGIPETCEKMQHLGKAIHLPLSVDVDYVKRFRMNKSKDTAFAGRRPKRKGLTLPEDVDYLEDMPRDHLLAEMARYKKIYAVGRTAIEARILGCEILPYDPRFPDPERWEIWDTREAAYLLQKKLEEIDGKEGDMEAEDQSGL